MGNFACVYSMNLSSFWLWEIRDQPQVSFNADGWYSGGFLAGFGFYWNGKRICILTGRISGFGSCPAGRP